jgi:hypothetical protein
MSPSIMPSSLAPPIIPAPMLKVVATSGYHCWRQVRIWSSCALWLAMMSLARSRSSGRAESAIIARVDISAPSWWTVIWSRNWASNGASASKRPIPMLMLMAWPSIMLALASAEVLAGLGAGSVAWMAA